MASNGENTGAAQGKPAASGGAGRSRLSLNWLVAASVAATIGRICLTLFTYGTNDASMWESSAQVIRESKGQYLYTDVVEVRDPGGKFLHRQIFNHPPFMIHVLSGLNRVADGTGIPVHTSLRLLDAVADVGTVVLTCAVVQGLWGSIPVQTMSLIAMAPAWMFVSGFHVNSDPMMLFFLLLTVYFIDLKGRTSLGALSFAFATGIKIVPILLLPAFLWYLGTRGKRLRAILILAMFWSATASPWLMTTPAAMFRNVLAYPSLPSHWGIGLLLSKAGFAAPERIFNTGGRYGMIAVAIAMSWRWSRRERPIRLFCQFGILLFLFHLLTPGFGIQYLAWLTPWTVTLPPSVVLSHVAASGAFCGAVYTYWSGGVPWYYANSIATGTWRGASSLLGFVAWLTVAWVLAAYRRQSSGRRCDPRL